MGGQVRQPSATSQYEYHGNLFPSSHTGDAADAVMARLLQSAGLQHLASPSSSPALDPRLLQNLLMQDYARHGVQSLEDRQKLFRLIKSISSGAEPASEPLTPPTYGFGRQNGVDGLSSPELRGEIGAGILDLHSIDDIELLSEEAVHEPFEASPFVSVTEKGLENELEASWSTNKPRSSKHRAHDESSPMRAAIFEKELTGKDSTSGLARIKVVVRKRPLNKKEIGRKEEDIVTIEGNGSSITVHEPKLKVDLTAYVEKHDFVFDAVLDEQVSNDEVYRVTVEPIIPTIFQRTKATCFAYGQTGSGKTYTMQPLPLRACQDILNMMQHLAYRNQGLQLWLSFFEIYGGKLYDLLNDRGKLFMREDGRQQVCIVGLKEFPVSNVELVKDYIEKGNASRSTGSTGANEESSRSHAILQLVIKKHANKKEERGGKLVGKFSFIDLAGSERGADTTDNDRQTRIEGAEINKSLLALKECIRALDHEQGHIPFRGSKLTEVLRDSFVGDSRTVMISCISPNTGSCEHTLNTLRYADRVKGLSKNSNSKRDPSPNTGVQIQKDSSSTSPPSISPEGSNNIMDYRLAEVSKKAVEQVSWQTQSGEPDGWSFLSSNQGFISNKDSKVVPFSADKDHTTVRDTRSNSFNYQREQVIERNEQEKASPPQRKVVKDDKPDKYGTYIPNDEPKFEKSLTMPKRTSYKEELAANSAQSSSKDVPDMILQNEYDSYITAILEEEEDLIAAHRLEVEDTMELVREEMKLLTEVDQPGSRIDRYVSHLSNVLSRKAAGIVNLQARLARFQRHLKEQEILSRNMGTYKFAMASSSHTGDAKEETSHMDSHRVFPTDEELATYKISNTSGARWRWKELADLSAVADLVDGNLSAARVSLNSIGWDSSFVAGSAGVGEVIGNVAVWSIAAVASYGVNRQRVQSGDVRLNERAIIGQTTAGLRERIAVRYTRLGAGVDRSTPELYFDFALFLDSLALDYLRKRSRYINSVLGVSMETELSVLRSFVAPNDRSSNMVSFYTRCWLRLFDVIWCEAHGVALAWGGGANGVVNVNVFSNGATWTAHSRPALMRCQAGASVSLVVDSLTDVEIDALFIIAAQFGVVTDFQSGNTQYVPYSSRYEFGAMTFEVWCFEAWVRLSGAGTHAMNANNPHAAVRSGVPVGSEDLRNILHKIATHRVEQSQLASAFGVAAGLFVGRPFILRNVAAVNGVAARSFIPARPVITALTMRMPVDLAPLFPMFAQDAYVDPANCNDALLLSSMTTGELYVLAAHIGKCTGYAYSTAMALLNMSGGAMVRDTRRSQAVRSDLGLLTTTTLAASSLDEIARASYIRTFYLAPQPFQFGGVSSGFSPDFNTEGNNTRSIQKFVQGMSLPVTVLSQEVLQSASALPYTSTLPLVGDRAVARSLVTQVGTTWRVGFPGSEALIPGDMETFEPELLLRTFLVGELCTAQFPITMVHKEAVTRPDMVDWVAGPDLQILGGPLPGTFMAQESTAITRLGSGDWRRARVNVPAHHAGRFLTSMEFEGTRNRIALIWPMAGVTDSYLSGPVIFSTSKITQGSGMLRGDSVTQLSTAQMVKECVGRAKNLEQLLASIEEVRSSIVARYDRAKAHLSARMAELHLPRPLIPAKRTFSQVASDVLVDATPPPEPSDGASNL